MKVHQEQQGTNSWLALRRDYFTASEAPAIMGVSPYTTRSELLQQKTTGIMPEVDARTQARFDAGHAAEALFRPVVEALIGQDLYPVTGSIEIEGLKLLASFDGLTMDDSIGFEHKTINADLRRLRDDPSLPLAAHYVWQLEQQLLVSGASLIHFFASDGTTDDYFHMQYRSDPARREQLIAGWKQFAEDLVNYVPVAKAAPAPVGRAPETLPALRIELSGVVTASNLQVYKDTALAVFKSINRELTTDQQFSDAEKTVKWCSEIEDRIKAAKQHALSQTESIDLLFRTMDEISEEARTVRLELDKLVKHRKDAVRTEIVDAGRVELLTHVEALNARLGKPYLHVAVADWQGAVKGKRTIDSMTDAVAVTLANAKIAASAEADKVEMNLKSFRELATGHEFLFADIGNIVLKANDDFVLLVNARISEHKAAEAARLEAERDRIRAEEVKKLADAAAAEAARVVASQPKPEVVAPVATPTLASVPAPVIRPIPSAEFVAAPNNLTINAFLASRTWSTPAAEKTARATVVEYEKFCAQQMRVAA